MSKRVSHSVLDPVIGPRLQSLYPHLRIPTWFPPEGIVGIGHACAIAGAVGFAFSTQTWWGGLLAAAGVVGNHTADCVDGTHARRTGQCRNGGELLDHFTDPMSFAYWLVGISIACGRLDLGLVAVILLFAVAVLTNIKAKLTGEFTLAKFGPTEFKASLVAAGVALSAVMLANLLAIVTLSATSLLTIGYIGLIGIGLVYLPVNLVKAVKDVNANGAEPDTSEWITTS